SQLVVSITVVNANAGADQTICSNSSSTLTATGGTSFKWSYNNSTNQSIIVSPTTTSTYYVTVTNLGCTAKDTVVVNVSSSIVVSAGKDQTICKNASTILTATGSSTYTWNTGEMTSSINVSPTLTTTYTVTANSGTCSASDNVIVNVSNTQAGSAGADQTICNGSSSTITATGGASYHWSTGETTPSIVVSPADSTTYTVTITSSDNCVSTDEVNVVVKQVPQASAGQDVSVCKGSQAALSATGGDSYIWSTNETSASINPIPTSTTIYTVTVTANGCSSSANVTVNVIELIVDAGGNQTINKGDTAILVANPSGGNVYSFVWSQNAGNSISVKVSPSLTTTYIVTITDQGCSATGSVAVVVNQPGCNLSVDAGQNVTIENGQAANLTGNATGGAGYSYLWSNGQTTSTITVSPTVTTTYFVTVTVNGGTCSATDNVVVKVNTTGIKENILSGSESISVYPNPAISEISISFNNIYKNDILLNIYNNIGEVVRQEVMKNSISSPYKLNISGLSKGIYFLQFRNNELNTIRKIAIE
ncbi:MAG: T9SS type A sorting domain-containing protein, partial [Bacteroidota bacterium]|nr:T9SS type A sorting domain-containing protein [Bacteroidota bacterium]